MKKSILTLGKALNKAEQKEINGGKVPVCCLDWDPIERYCSAWQSNCVG